jgi:hypothetical protein
MICDLGVNQGYFKENVVPLPKIKVDFDDYEVSDIKENALP